VDQPGTAPLGTPAGAQADQAGEHEAVPGTAPLGSASSNGSGASASPVTTPIDSPVAPAGSQEAGATPAATTIPGLVPSGEGERVDVTYNLVDQEGKPLTQIRVAGVDPRTTQMGIRTAEVGGECIVWGIEFHC
jgi:hypothetical protein